MHSQKFDGLSITAIVIMLWIGMRLFGELSTGQAAALVEAPLASAPASELVALAATPIPQPEIPQTSAVAIDLDTAFAAPYTDYVVTQGIHGTSYGHMAIDLAAGKDAPVLSPIHGIVTAKYVDQYGNTTLIIENSRFQVLLLHGNYSVEVGQSLSLGDQLGLESNNGYTTDMQGRPCAGRPCGYHTHLNVYDKLVGANVNPLELIAP